MTMQLNLDIHGELIIDNFAGGGDEAEELNARTGCIACPLAQEEKALESILSMPRWSHLAPLRELKPIYRWLREPAQRLRKSGIDRLKDGSIGKNPQRMGPLTLEARLEALDKILDVQNRINAGTRHHNHRLDMINAEEEARIRQLIAGATWPDGWDGDEPRADEWLPVTIYGNGAEQHDLFGLEEA